MCLTKVFPDEQRFFYVVDCPSNSTREWGIGYIREDRLVREYGLSFLEDSRVTPCRDYYVNDFPENSYVVVKSYIPSSVHELTAYPYSVLCSQEQGIASPVDLQDDTLLGRYKGSVQSIDETEFSDMMGDAVVNAVCKSDKPLTLKSKTLEMEQGSRIRTSVLFLRQGERPEAPQPGMIIFDSSSKRFLGYNGLAWVPLG